jgi:hypothetical protein
MSIDKTKAVLKIQKNFRLYRCIKTLKNFIKLNLNNNTYNFNKFKKLISNKETIEIADKFCKTLELYKKKFKFNTKSSYYCFFN